MADVSSILTRLITSLTVSDPTWDVSVGSATYKILESVANEIALTTNNSTLQTYSYDVNSKSGTELDAFVNLFGITRQLGKRSTGTVTFTLTSPATSIITIPGGTQVYVPSTVSSTGSNVYFQTVSSANIAVGQTEVEVPITSTLPGSFNNVAANTISVILNTIVGLPTVTNYNPLTGGIDTETDVQLQNRWNNTAFSNISGTTDKFVAVALQDSNISQINVVGSQQSSTQQLQVVTTISGNSTFNLGLNFQAQLIAASGSSTATLINGSFPPYTTVPSGSYVAVPSGSYVGSIYNNGTSYNLSTPITQSGGATINVNYTTSSGTFSGSTSSNNLALAVGGMFAPLNIPGLIVTGSGTSPSTTGVQIQLSQPTGYNVIVSSGSAVTSVNTITSQIPDSKYTYPAGYEAVGLNLGSANQTLFNNTTDYIYPTTSGVPLIIPLVPTAINAPYTYTGNLLELASQYIPTSSRITNPTVNSNFIDIFINGSASNTTTEQIIFQPTVKFNTINGSVTNVSGFTFSNGQNISLNSPVPTASGDYYIGFSNRPVINFPAQVVAGNAPSFITFGSNSSGNIILPICLEYVNNGAATPMVTGISGLIGTNILSTISSISKLYVGLAISGTGIGSPTTTLSGIPFGSFITQLVPGSPNLIYLNNTLTGNVNPSTMTFATVCYPVYDITNNAGSILDATGIGIDAVDQIGYTALGIPPYVTPMVNLVGTISNAYNADVVQVNDLVQQSRVIGSNVLVRQAQYLNLLINLSVIYANNVNVNSVNNDIQTALTQYLESITYTGTITLSNIANAVLNVSGVRGARVSTYTDNPVNYGISTVAIDGTILTTYTTDIPLANNQLASLYNTNVTTFGSNNF